MIRGTLAKVSTLLSTVGLANRPCSTVRGGFDAGHAAVAFDGGGQGAAFAADERAGAFADFDVEIKSGAEDIRSQQAVFPGIGDRLFQAAYRERIFGADVDVTFGGAAGDAGDHHAFQHPVGVAFHHASVHESAGVAFVAIADDIFLLSPSAA